jgi:hypothetical protein
MFQKVFGEKILGALVIVRQGCRDVMHQVRLALGHRINVDPPLKFLGAAT